jgi:hypothetical protein
MRLERALLAAALLGPLVAPLAADSGGPVRWLDGTRGWDSTPQEEADPQLLSAFGDGRPALGAGLSLGLLDTLQADGYWLPALPGGQDSAEVAMKWRDLNAPDRWPGTAFYARAPWAGGRWTWRAGVVLEWDPWDWSLALNTEAGEADHSGMRAALMTPYLLYTLRLGAEADVEDADSPVVTPQLSLNFPGDISLDLGLRLDPGRGDQRWLLRASYELFPSPPAFPDDVPDEKKP